MRDALESIIARLDAATGPDRELDTAIWRALDNGVADKTPLPWLCLYTERLDSVLGLVDKKLPGWTWTLHSPRSGLKYGAALHDHKTRGGIVRVSEHEGNAALALCLALCRALLAQQTETVHG